MRIGTIGSGTIVDRMIQAVKQTEGMQIEAIYSRSEQKARAFAQKHSVKQWYTDLDAMLASDIDTVYVASPNSLHYPQALKALQAGKHVICEKPFVPTGRECETLFETAREHGVYIFEAITNQFVPNYQVVKDHLKDCGTIQMIQANYSQYSSRYGKYLAKEQTNAFDPAFYGGALMDINVYCLHFVIGLLGKPDKVTYTANKGYNGVDTSGVVVLQYPDRLAVCVGAKDSSSENQVMIQGDKGCLRVYGSGCGVCAQVEFLEPKGDMIGKKDTSQAIQLGQDQAFHMIYECRAFQKIVAERDEKTYQKLCEQTKNVVSILETCRGQIQYGQ